MQDDVDTGHTRAIPHSQACVYLLVVLVPCCTTCTEQQVSAAGVVRNNSTVRAQQNTLCLAWHRSHRSA
jgi:hypothetical protein